MDSKLAIVRAEIGHFREVRARAEAIATEAGRRLGEALLRQRELEAAEALLREPGGAATLGVDAVEAALRPA